MKKGLSLFLRLFTFTMSLLSDLINLNLSDTTEKVIAEYIWLVSLPLSISLIFFFLWFFLYVRTRTPWEHVNRLLLPACFYVVRDLLLQILCMINVENWVQLNGLVSYDMINSVLLYNTWFCAIPFKNDPGNFWPEFMKSHELKYCKEITFTPDFPFPPFPLAGVLVMFHIFCLCDISYSLSMFRPPVQYIYIYFWSSFGYFVRVGVVFRIRDVYFTLYFSGYAAVWLYSVFDCFKDELALLFVINLKKGSVFFLPFIVWFETCFYGNFPLDEL